MKRILSIKAQACLLGAASAGCASAPTGHSGGMSAWESMRESWTDETSAELSFMGKDAGAHLDSLLRHGRANNPGLQAAFQRWKVALERVPQVTALPEPRLQFSGYLAEVETRVGPMQGRIGLMQPLPWFGKLDLAGDVAFEASEMAREELEAARLELDARIRCGWYEYAWLSRALQITEGNLELLTHWESVARSRMETGLGRHADVIRAQVELGKLDDRVASLRDLHGPLTARLNGELNRPLDASLPEPSFPLPEPAAIDGIPFASKLAVTSPVLRALEHRVLAAGHAAGLAEKAYYPDFSVGVDYTFIGSAAAPGVSGSGDDAVALTLGLDLPIWRNAYRAGQRGADAELKGARLDQDAARNRLAAELEMALFRFRDAHRRLGLFRSSLVPKGEQSVQSLDIAYQSGDQGFLDLIDAHRVLLEFQLQAARAEVDRAIALADIERITAVPIHPEPKP